MKIKNRPTSESQLCRLFSEKARRDGWNIYPEVDGWDLVMVRDGVQVGVEAKLSMSWRALAQAVWRVSPNRSVARPHFAAVLTTMYDRDFRMLTREVGVGHYTWMRDVRRVTGIIKPDGHRVVGATGLELPTIPLQDTGGKPSPRQLTKWRENAIRLAAALERGPVSGHEFDRLEVSRAFFLKSGWMEPLPKEGMRSGQRKSGVWEVRDGKRRIVYQRRAPPYRTRWPTDRYEAERDLILEMDAAAGDSVFTYSGKV